jgi:hypothetical protein
VRRIDRGGGDDGEPVQSPPGQHEISLAVWLISVSQEMQSVIHEDTAWSCLMMSGSGNGIRHMAKAFKFSNAIICATVLTFASDPASAGDLRQLQEDQVRTAYACGAASSPKLFKWFKEWEAYRRWDEGNPRATNVLAFIDEDELEAIANPSRNKVPAIGCKAWLDQHQAAGAG